MRIHFFTAPFYFAFIGFRVQGSGFKVQGSGIRWRLRRLFSKMVFSHLKSEYGIRGEKE